MALPNFDRWERKLKKRGPKQKRSGRYTKKGERPRSATKEELAEKALEAVPLARLEPETHRWILPLTNDTSGTGNSAFDLHQPGMIQIWNGENRLATTSSISVNQDHFYEPVHYYGTTAVEFVPAAPRPVELTVTNDTTGGTCTYVAYDYTVVDNTTVEITNPHLVRQTMGDFADAGMQAGQAIGDWAEVGFGQYRLDPKEAARQRIRENLDAQQIANTINHRGQVARATHRPADFTQVSQAEIVALQMMKNMLPDKEWRRYLKYGFVVIQGKSGMFYQIIRGQSHIKVYRRGTKVAELCISIPRVPPTDGVIARKIMIECDEMRIWHDANIHGNVMGYKTKPTEQDLYQLAAAA